ncbi:MAG: hypothetical protein UZ07_CHB004003237 [Chlorobi bacterium OLB7]|nr:MAG: hypothetical protein UZ07_CHB004003237 [Chlorobi bacterium OLB7]
MPSSQQLQALAERHLARLARRVRQRAAQSRQLSYIRLGLFLGSVLLATVAYQSGYQVVGAALLAVGLSGFAVAAHRHSKVERSIRRYRRWMEIKQAHLARMRHDWENIPLPPTLPPTEGHPFETDLNITGPRSLLHLIDTSVSAEGSNRLRQWLLQREANPGLIRSRATLVRQLLPRSLFRDRLALAGALAARKQEERWTGAEFMAWLQAHANQQSLFPWLVALLLLAGTTLLLLLLALLNVLPAAWPFSLGVYALLYIARGKDYRELYSDALDLEVHLHRFGAVLLHLERFGYAARRTLPSSASRSATPHGGHRRGCVALEGLSPQQACRGTRWRGCCSISWCRGITGLRGGLRRSKKKLGKRSPSGWIAGMSWRPFARWQTLPI